MPRLPILAGAAVLVLSTAMLGGPASARTPDAGPALVINQDFPDPDVSQFGNTYFAYATNNGVNLPVATAPAAGGPWTVQSGDALPQLGAWASAGRTWAPDVSRRADGKYLLYYAAHSTSANTQCLGAALADDPAGPFTPIGDQPLVCDASEGGEIDPSSFVDSDGSRYLVYKNDGNSIGQAPSIWLQPVAADGITFTGPRVKLLQNDRPDENSVIEAPVVVKRPSQYVLFYSASGYSDDSYRTGFATSPTLAAAFTKSDTPLMTTESTGVHGPGGADPVGGQIFFHGWINDHTARGMYVADLTWNGDTPVV
ncbi:MAG TPA: glycoside hydrolase family 43 protein [Mycobacteriales bacterium]|nr:glycoside hydrolase family 43 protein [Mycobacteriales bacterium]